jgi:uncharacterized membrane protein YgcG
MEGAAALRGVGDGTSQEPADSRVARRRLGLIALIVVIAFGAAFAIGAATKKHTAPPAAPQLEPSTSVQGAHTVGVTAVSANAAIPDLKSPPPPKHKPAKQTTSTSSSSTAVAPTTPSTPSNPGTFGGGGTGGGGTVGGGGTGGGGTVGGGGTAGGGTTGGGTTGGGTTGGGTTGGGTVGGGGA